MIETEKFVYVHYPKTAGTFVTAILFELKDLLKTREIYTRNALTLFTKAHLKHGTCRSIPSAKRHLPVLASYRSPYDIYVSEFEFGWWRRPEYVKHFSRRIWRFKEKYPDYPELTFDQFLRLYNEAFCYFPRNRDLHGLSSRGWLTERFVRFFYRHPFLVLLSGDDRHFEARSARAKMFDIAFVRTENINEDLQEFLAHHGLDRSRLEFISERGKILPDGKGRSEAQRWEQYYTADTKKWVRRRERSLFDLFPEYDV